jgi:hypothetical protein
MGTRRHSKKRTEINKAYVAKRKIIQRERRKNATLTRERAEKEKGTNK